MALFRLHPSSVARKIVINQGTPSPAATSCLLSSPGLLLRLHRMCTTASTAAQKPWIQGKALIKML